MTNQEAGAKLVQLYADFRRYFKDYPPYVEAVALAISALAKDGEG